MGKKINNKHKIIVLTFGIALCLPFLLSAQTEHHFSSAVVASESIRSQIIAFGLAHNPSLKAITLIQQSARVMKRTHINLPNPDILLDVYNRKTLIKEGFQNNYVVSVLERFDFPTSFAARRKMLQASYELANANSMVVERHIAKQIDMLYTDYLFIRARKELFYQYNAIFENLLKVTKQAYDIGATTDLVRTSLQLKQQEIYNLYRSSIIEEEKSRASLSIFLRDTGSVLFQLLQTPDSLVERNVPVLSLLDENPSAYLLTQASKKVRLRKEEKKYLWHQQLLPQISIGLKYDPTLIPQPLMGFTIGLGIPLFFWTPQATVQSAYLNYLAEQKNQEQTTLEVSLFNQRLQASYKNVERELHYYKEQMHPLITNTETKIQTAYISGSISMIEYFLTLAQMMDMKLRYYDILRRHNDIVSQILYGGISE